MTTKLITPSQTVGPFFAYGLSSKGKYDFNDVVTDNAVTADTVGERIVITGILTDGNGNPINDGLIEIWQADASGSYASRNSTFKGMSRAATNDAGVYRIETIKAGSVKGNAPFFNVHVLARGVLRHLHTRAYFADNALNAKDQVLAMVPKDRVNTLMMSEMSGVFTFNISIQGENETVFFEVE
jgi:protocatechuate 3,4-dioxygenase alpha subunit